MAAVMPYGSDMPHWEIDLFACGECYACMYACFCPCCAIAEARSQLDGSQCCFNYCCILPCPVRWMIRTAYGIPGSACNDVLLCTFCPCCSANQVYQTTFKRGNPTFDGGYHLNRNKFVTEAAPFQCWTCLKACFCNCCANGDALNKSTGMPFALGCCCVSPCATYQITRYQYRLQGTDIGMDCVLPSCLTCFGLSCAYCCSLCTCGLTLFCLVPILPFTVGRTMTSNAESDARNGEPGKGGVRYLTNPVWANMAAAGGEGGYMQGGYMPGAQQGGGIQLVGTTGEYTQVPVAAQVMEK